MSNIFWGLKDNWWKQIIDGKYHKYGPKVFDEGTHGGKSEPGFYDGIKNACEYAITQIDQPLTVEFYKKIHHIACVHFVGVNRSQISLRRLYYFSQEAFY